MKHKQLYFLLFVLFPVAGFCQPANLRNTDLALTQAYKIMISADPDIRYEQQAPVFRAELIKQLNNPATFTYTFDSLSKYIRISVSPDKQIRFFSWDDYTGGSWHRINSIAQFRTGKNKVIVQPLDDEKDAEESFTNSYVYNTHVLTMQKQKFYLTFAYGTHGLGNEYEMIRVFQIKGDQLLTCDACFPYGRPLVIQYPRSEEKINLYFDPKANMISHREFREDPETGLYRTTGKTINVKINLERCIVQARPDLDKEEVFIDTAYDMGYDWRISKVRSALASGDEEESEDMETEARAETTFVIDTISEVEFNRLSALYSPKMSMDTSMIFSTDSSFTMKTKYFEQTFPAYRICECQAASYAGLIIPLNLYLVSVVDMHNEVAFVEMLDRKTGKHFSFPGDFDEGTQEILVSPGNQFLLGYANSSYEGEHAAVAILRIDAENKSYVLTTDRKFLFDNLQIKKAIWIDDTHFAIAVSEPVVSRFNQAAHLDYWLKITL